MHTHKYMHKICMKMQSGCPVGIQGGTPRYASALQWSPGVSWGQFGVIFGGLRGPWDRLATSLQLHLDPAGQRRAEETPKVVTARRIEFQMASQRASLSPQAFILC